MKALKNTGATIQINNANCTEAHRYPHIFKDLQFHTSELPAVTTLSVGCSSGEEVRSLRELNPSWVCHGVEISDAARADAVSQDPDGVYCKDIYSMRESSYDALLCMSVLCLQDPETFTFTDFEDIIEDFCRILKLGGIMVLNNVQYSVLDSPKLATLLDPIPNRRGNGAGYVIRFDAAGENPRTPSKQDPYMFR